MDKETNSPIKNMLTGIDNETHDLVRVMGALIILVFLGLAIYIVVTTKVFDMSTFCVSASGLLLGISGGIKLKETVEPK